VGTVLKYNDTLYIDYRSVNDWTCVADGFPIDVAIILRVGRSDILLGYTPDIYTNPDNPADPDHPFTQNVYMSGNIFITTEGKTVWVKPLNPNFPVTISGEIVYNIGPFGPMVQPIDTIDIIGMPQQEYLKGLSLDHQPFNIFPRVL
jgi:hypothetical protein